MTRSKQPPDPPEQRWMFGSVIVYAANQFQARQAYEQFIDGGFAEACGTVTLKNGTQVRWVNLRRKLNN